MIKVLIFDADGVLINGDIFSKRFSKEYNIDLSRINPFFDGPFKECLVGKADLKEVIAPYLEEWGWKDGVDSFLEYWFSSEHSIDQELIDYIQVHRENGIKCVMATNQEKYRAEYLFNKIGFINSFDKMYVSAHLGHKKTNVEFFEKLVNDLVDIKKDEVLFWDDDIQNIETAKEFGINAELYTTFEDFKQKMKDYLFNN
jgi:putative hydrolase of the HAD superfamily